MELYNKKKSEEEKLFDTIVTIVLLSSIFLFAYCSALLIVIQYFK